MHDNRIFQKYINKPQQYRPMKINLTTLRLIYNKYTSELNHTTFQRHRLIVLEIFVAELNYKRRNNLNFNQ